MCPTDHFQRGSTVDDDDDDDDDDTRHTTHDDDDDARAMWGPTGARARTMMRTCVHRAYAATGAAKPAAQHDVVQRVFVEQQQKFRALLEKTKTLTPPIGGDATAVKAYAAKKMAILKELQIASPGERITDTLDSAFAQAKTVRGFLEYASNLRQTLGLKEEGEDVLRLMMQALDETEKSLGGPLLQSNAQGMAKYGQKVTKLAEAAGVKPMDKAALAKLTADVDLEAIQNELAELKAIEDEVKREEV